MVPEPCAKVLRPTEPGKFPLEQTGGYLLGTRLGEMLEEMECGR